MTLSTQIKHPWRTTARSVFQAFVTLASVAPSIYSAAMAHDAALAKGWVGAGLVIAGAVTRVMAMPQVDDFLAKFIPFLATTGSTQK